MWASDTTWVCCIWCSPNKKAGQVDMDVTCATGIPEGAQCLLCYVS